MSEPEEAIAMEEETASLSEGKKLLEKADSDEPDIRIAGPE